VESGLYFANADHVGDSIRSMVTGSTRAVVLDAETMPSVDVTGAAMLVSLALGSAESGHFAAPCEEHRPGPRRRHHCRAGRDIPGRYETIDDAITAVQADRPGSSSGSVD
jgi:sulfate permease, SulP family